MTQFVLDSDVISLLQYGDENIVRHLSQVPPEDVATTIITVEEQLSGWYTLLRKAKHSADLVPVYERMTATVEFLRRLPILSFTQQTAELYDNLRREHRRTGRMDLRIAAIVIAHDATLVTRNSVDFERIGNLRIVDWSK